MPSSDRTAITAEMVTETLRGEPGIQSVSVQAAALEATVTLFLADGADAYEVVCRATDRLRERLPRVELQVTVVAV
jgi:hypothetical protein